MTPRFITGVIIIIFGAKTFHRCQSYWQGAVKHEMFIADQAIYLA